MKKILFTLFFFLLFLTETKAQNIEVVGTLKIKGGTPGIGKVLTSDATGLASWVTPVTGATLVLPYSASQNSLNNTLFRLENTNTSNSSSTIVGVTNGVGQTGGSMNAVAAIEGIANGNNLSNSTYGVRGINNSPHNGYLYENVGVYGYSFYAGVKGESEQIGVLGVGKYFGTVGYTGIGVYGKSSSGVAGQFESNSSYGLKIRGKLQFAGNGVGTLVANKFLKSINTNGDAEWSDLLPLINSQNATQNILEITNTNTGGFSTIVGKTSTTGSGSGVEGIATHTGTNSNSRGVTGINLSTTSLGSGVYGFHAGSGNAVAGNSDDGIGVYGTSNDNIGIKGISTKNNGVYGETAAGNNRAGVFGKSISVFANSYGVYGNADKGSGIKGESLDGIGVESFSSNGFGVFAKGGYVGGYFTSTGGYALLTDNGKVGIGNIPSLNADERMEINGRLRIRDSTNTAGVWFNNSANGIGIDNGAFYGLENAVSGSERAGIWIGSAWRFYINRVGNANFTGTVTATGFPIASDFRYKKNIQPLENTLSKIQKIVGVSYDLRKDEFPEKNFSDKPQIGFIAQDLEKIFPEMVFTDEKGYKSVDYARLTPVLVEALKELILKNQTLESRLDKIEAMLSTIQPNTENLNSKK